MKVSFLYFPMYEPIVVIGKNYQKRGEEKAREALRTSGNKYLAASYS